MVSKIYQKDYFSYIFTLRRQYFEQNSWLNKAQEPQNMDILMHFSVAKDNHTKFKIKKSFFFNTVLVFQSKYQQWLSEQK